MTHPNFASVTNGASLEDCHTNFFALADLCGIRWRRLAIADSLLSTSREPLEDPVLTSYSKCLAADLLCVWRRVVSNRTSSLATGDGPAGGATASGGSGRSDPGPPQATFAKELWIFWYGKEPDLSEFVSSELTEIEQGSWENGLSYECRTLLFKAFHNLIERCLLSRGFARFGRWFVQPLLPPTADRRHQSSTSNNSSPSSRGATPGRLDSKTQLTIAFNFFVHGESTVCASIDVRQHPPVYRISKSHLSAALEAQSSVDVILSPYGIAGVLTGQAFKENDPSVQRLLNEWKQFYPINQSQKESSPKQQSRHTNAPFHIDLDDVTSSLAGGDSVETSSPSATSSSEGSGHLPQVVEVVVAGIKMKYPSCYVYLAADSTDSPLLSLTKTASQSSNNSKAAHQAKGESATTTPAHTSSSQSSSLLTPPCSPSDQLGDSAMCSKPPHMAPQQPILPSAGFKLRDAINQEINVSVHDKQHSSNQQASSNGTIPGDAEPNSLAKWEFADPCSKVGCNCFRCKVSKKGANQSAKSGSTLSLPGSGGNKSSKADKIDRQQKVLKELPFHKRNLSVEVLLDIEQQQASTTARPASSATGQNSGTNGGAAATPAGATVNASSLQTTASQPKTPSFSYKSPMGPGGLSSVQSGATTPGNCLDSPRSAAPSISQDGPPSTNPEPMSLPSVSPHPVKSEIDFQGEPSMPGRSPAVSSVGGGAPREKSHLEQLLSPYPNANSLAKSNLSIESPAVNWPPSVVSNSDTAEGGNSNAPTALANGQTDDSTTDSKGIKRPLLATGHEDELERINRSLLYDYSSLRIVTESWDLPQPKRRRNIYVQNSNNQDPSSFMAANKPSNNNNKDPYEFSEFDDDPFGIKSNSSEVTSALVENAQVLNGIPRLPDEFTNGDGFNCPLSNGNSKANSSGSDHCTVTSPVKSRDFTRADDLTPSFGDLDNLFDTSSGEESSEQPNSFPNVPRNGQTLVNGNDKRKNSNANGNNNSSSQNHHHSSHIPGVTELIRMFPTPPSLEPNAAPSPNVEASLLDESGKIDVYPSSPASLEHLKDASCVYKPPILFKFIASCKYGPLKDLQSNMNLPAECVYKLSAKTNHQQQQMIQQQQQMHQQALVPMASRSSGYVYQQNNMPPHGYPGPHHHPMMMRHMAPPGLHGQFYQGPPGPGNPHQMSMSPGHRISRPQFPPGMSPQHVMQHGAQGHPVGPGPLNQHPQMHPNHQSPGQFSPYMNPTERLGQMNPNMYSPHHHGQSGPGGDIIAPSHHAHSPYGGQFSNQSHSHGQQLSPRGPQHHGMSPLGSQQQHHGPPHGPPGRVTPMGGFGGAENRDPAFMAGAATRHRAPENTVAPVVAQHAAPEVNALLVNLALSDSVMNLYKDHNFESCTLCVCNMNLKGADVGVYLPDALIPGISDESQYKCTCGFSAVINRHRSALAGLFYEDEVEITGIVYDPAESSLTPRRPVLSIDCDTQPIATGAASGGSDSVNDGGANASGTASSGLLASESSTEQMSQVLVDLVRAQCSTLLSSCSLFSKALNPDLSSQEMVSAGHFINNNSKDGQQQQASNVILSGLKVVNKGALKNCSDAILRSDSCELTYFALISGKSALDAYPPKMITQQIIEKRSQKASCLHNWQFLETDYPSNNHDTVRFLRSLQPLLQASVQKKPKAMWEVTYNVAGPLTWRQFHRLAGRGTEDQCEPQPIPSLLVGHDKDWVCVSPFALKYWEKLLLEPYSVTRDVAYLVVAPNNSYIIPQVRTFFKELSTTYEMLRLGKHCPIVNILRDGIMKVAMKANVVEEQVDDWFNQIGDSNVAAKLKLYAQTCKAYLVPLIKAQPIDRTLFEQQKTPQQPTPPGGDGGANGATNSSSQPPPGSSAYGSGLSSFNKTPGSSSQPDSHSSDSKGAHQFGDDNTNEAPSHGLPSFSTMAQQDNEEEDPTKQPAIVIYIVEPFTFANLDEHTYRLACLGLLRCYSQMLKFLPENVQNCINLQIISLDAIMGAGADFRECTRQEQLKSLAFAVFSQSRKSPVPPSISKSLTGFGPAASLDHFLKEHPSPTTLRLYAPPYMLAPLKDKNTELGHMFGDQREKSHNMFVSYCLTEDQKWIVASCSNERGDLLETNLINIEVPNRTRRRKASVRRYGLHKLMEFILQVMSDCTQSWRLIIGRLGRVGHGELREWSSLLSKKALLRYSKNLKEPCTQCKQICTHDAPLILSACLISLEADTALRVFSDQYTPDDRFSSSCNTCSLSTPEDASCTHILTFPTSTTMQSSQGTFQIDPIGMGSMGDDDLMNAFGADTEDLGVDDGIGGLFDWGDPDDPTMPVSPGDGGHGLPGHGSTSPNHQGTGFDNPSNRVSGVLGDVPDEPLQLLQQPLALGYYVSTAPTGPLPKWFWSSAPHLKDTRPSFLKSALLIHIPSVQQNNDDLYQSNTNKNYHPMDSNLTTDVLRYVLEGYNSLSWLSIDPATHDRTSCLPVHIQTLLQLYHTVQALT